jgi:hypothetical protein
MLQYGLHKTLPSRPRLPYASDVMHILQQQLPIFTPGHLISSTVTAPSTCTSAPKASGVVGEKPSLTCVSFIIEKKRHKATGIIERRDYDYSTVLYSLEGGENDEEEKRKRLPRKD